MVSAQRNAGASVIAFRGIDVTPTATDVTPRSMLLLLLLHERTKKACNGRRHNNKYVYVAMGVLPVIFNTHTILLTKSISSLYD